MCVHMNIGAYGEQKKTVLASWSWSHRELWAAQHGFWDLKQ